MFILTFNYESIIIALSTSFVYECKGYDKTKLGRFNRLANATQNNGWHEQEFGKISI
jgi:hypothetical protein